ncbi:MAG: hypothetical protein EXQ74_05000 [Thermoleophilia bacterium]|nr:hypothetical protein [Thermoleophilia bacterium]
MPRLHPHFASVALLVGVVGLATAPATFAQSANDLRIELSGVTIAGGEAWAGPQGVGMSYRRPVGGDRASESLHRDATMSGSAVVGGRQVWGHGPYFLDSTVSKWFGSLVDGRYVVSVLMRMNYNCAIRWGSMQCSWSSQRTSQGFRIDAIPPEVPQLLISEESARSTDGIAWTPVGDYGSGLSHYELMVDEVPVARVEAQECGSTCVASVPAATLPDGAHSVHVRALDMVGNVSDSGIATLTVIDGPIVEMDAEPAFVIAGRDTVLRAMASVPNGGALTYAWDTDGDDIYETDTGLTPSVTVGLSAETVVGVRVTAPGGGTATDARLIDVRPAPGSEDPGVTINNGARFTATPTVTLSVSWPDGATTMRISTDGGFRTSYSMPVHDEVPFTLVADEGSRLPHVIYVRFRGKGISARETYSDDIILDTTTPVLTKVVAVDVVGQAANAKTHTAARTRRVRITTWATDAISGVRSIQVASSRRRGVVHTIPFAKVVTIPAPAGPMVVRVIDAAGNPSRWRAVGVR